ncbi:MAG: hypothetical protein QXZ44_03000 [Ferroplasma sp.]
MDVQIVEDSQQIESFMDIIKSAWKSESALSGFKDTIHSMAFHGGIVLAAYDGGKMVGISFAYPGYRHGHVYLYSHMTGVLDDKKYSGAGYELKMMQKKLALEYGYDLIAWTFDPVMSLNGHFNIGKLGAISRTYIDNFYGIMNDGINKGLPTDRLVAEWHIKTEFDRHYDNPYYMNGFDGNKMYVNEDYSHEYIALKLMKNFMDLKNSRLAEAVEIKLKLRDAMHALFKNGYTIINFDKESNAYILKKNFKLNENNIFI